jgi:hypothetical protein
LDKATLDKIQELANKYMIEDAEANPDYAKVAFSQVKYFKDYAEWRKIQEPFTFGRNLTNMDAMYSKLEAIAKKHKVYDSVIALERAVRKRMEKQEFWKMGTKYVENPITPK